MACVGGGRLVSSILVASKVWSPDDQSHDLMLHFSHITSATCDYLDTLADSIEAVVKYLPSPFLHPGVTWGVRLFTFNELSFQLVYIVHVRSEQEKCLARPLLDYCTYVTQV